MAQSPMKMNYSGKAPKGIPDFYNKSETKPSIMKGSREAGEKYKKPGNLSLRGKGAKDMSSSNNANPPESARAKNVYTQAKQPVQFSNAGTAKATRFVC